MAYLRTVTSRNIHTQEEVKTPFKQTPEDVHAIVRTIARRKYRYKQGENHALLLEKLNLENADFYEAHLEGARLNNTNLANASFRKAHLEEARLRRTILKGANFSLAHLEGAKLLGADLTGADLSGAFLYGTDLTDCIGLTQDQIIRANIDKKTQLPPYLLKSGEKGKRNS